MHDQTVMFVDLSEFNQQVGRTFRSIPQEVEPIVANLSISNMDFFEFADRADQIVLLGCRRGRLGVGSTGIGVRVLTIRRYFGLSTPVAMT
jgi:hypothetical protein